MSYVALYRKFRPPTFEDVKGQDHIVTTLKNQIKSDRLGHAYLFCGTRGTGKTSVAKILARSINCENPKDGNPCGECPTCKSIMEGRNVDVVEIDAASNNGVDNIRTIIEQVSYPPQMAKKKVYIIDEVHMLSQGAFNALLKTLEEPPEYVMFILATTEVNKIPITILSRCQRYDFHRITTTTIKDRLFEVVTKEGIEAEDKALFYIARAADGSMRDSLSLLDQCIAFNYGEVLTYDKVLSVLGAVDTTIFGKLFEALIKGDTKEALDVIAEIVIDGRELAQFVNDFVWYLRNLMLVSASADMEDTLDISEDNLKLLKEEAANVNVDTIMRYIFVFSELASDIKFSAQKRILIEMAIIRICKPQTDGKDQGALSERVRLLESNTNGIEKFMKQLKSGSLQIKTDAQGDASKDLPKKALDRAVPDDIKKIVESFNGFVNQMRDTSIKNILKKDRPRLSLGNGDTLVMVFESGIAAGVVRDSLGNLKTELAEFFVVDVDIEIKELASGERFENSYVDLEQNLSTINFDVVTEDEVVLPDTSI